MSFELPTLYHKGRAGKIYSWRVWTEENILCVEYGTANGKKSDTRKAIKGKNEGKSNATTPEEQAVKEAQAMHKHKLDRKYKLIPEETNEVIFLPMLATDYLKLKKKPKYPLDVQPKLDGVRCLAFWKDNKIVLLSRGGKEYSVPHIAEEVATFLPPGSVLDGELYVHGLSLQQINRLVKKHRDGPDGSIKLQYCVYDGFHVECTDHPWSRRKSDLQALFGKRRFFYEYQVYHLYTVPILNETSMHEQHELWEKDEFEGIILRLHDGKYELGHKSRSLIKLKNFQDAEFKIVGFKEATGNDIGTVVWECELEDGNTFTVRPVGTREQRKEWFDNGANYIGKMLTVKFQKLSDDGVPTCPTGKTIRLEEDLE